MTKCLAIFGIGSPFGADNIAQGIINDLSKTLSLPIQKVHIEYLDRPGVDLIEKMKVFDKVHLIDAVIGNNTVGKIYRFDNINQFLIHFKPLSSHGIGLPEVIALGDVMGELPSTIIIHGIEIDEATLGDYNSKQYLMPCKQLVNNIISELFQEGVL